MTNPEPVPLRVVDVVPIGRQRASAQPAAVAETSQDAPVRCGKSYRYVLTTRFGADKKRGLER